MYIEQAMLLIHQCFKRCFSINACTASIVFLLTLFTPKSVMAIHSFSQTNPISHPLVTELNYYPEQGMLVTFPTHYDVIYFENNSSQLTITMKTILNNIGYLLDTYKETYLVITLHTSGDLAYDRLYSVADYIAMQFKIEQERIQIMLTSQEETKHYKQYEKNWKNSTELIMPKTIIVTYDPELGMY